MVIEKMVLDKMDPLHKSAIRISVAIFLVCSVFQILPFERPIIDTVSAGSSWVETDWCIPDNYSTTLNLDTNSIPGSIKLEFTTGMYITDAGNDRIVLTDMNCNDWTTFGSLGSGIGQFHYPCGISYDSVTGNLYVADIMNNRIVQTTMGGANWTTYGTKGTEKGNFFRPYDVDYDDNSGFLYVADTLNGRIVKTKMNGSGWTKLGCDGSGVGQFYIHCGIFFDNSSNDIYVGDSHNHRIVKTKIDGSGWTTLGTNGKGVGQFDGTCGISYDATTGFVYVVDTWNNRIVRTRMDGSGWKSLGTYGCGVGEFDDPSGICFEKSTGFIYVADSGNNRIVKTRIDGSGWTTMGTLGNGSKQFNYPAYIALCERYYLSEGYIISKPYQCKGPKSFKTLAWEGETQTDTYMRFQLRSAESVAKLTQAEFVGPDGTKNTYYETSGDAIWFGHNNHSRIQYKAYLGTTNHSKTPRLDEVILKYNMLPAPPDLNTPQNGILLNENRPMFTWNFNDSDSLSQGGFQWQVDDDFEFTSVDYDSGEKVSNLSVHIPYTELPDGTWFWCVRTGDSDDDWGPYSEVWVITIDTTSPVSNVTFPVDDEFYKSLEKIEGYAFDPLNGSGIQEVEIFIKRLSDDDYWTGSKWSSNENWLAVVGTTNWEYDSSNVIWNSGDRYHIQSRSKDIAANIEVPMRGVMISIDMDAPRSKIDHPLDNSYLNNLTSIFGTAVDAGGAGIECMEISIKQMGAENYWDGKKWNSLEAWVQTVGTNQWEWNSSEIPWTTDTYYHIRSRARDGVENIEIPGQGNIFMYDNKAPDVSILINNGERFTRFSNVTLLLHAEDTGSGVDKVCFSNDNINWTGWVQFNAERSYNLPAPDGEKIVYFRAIDLAGNVAEPVYDSIILDTQPPENLMIEINNGDRFTNSEHVALSLYATDRISGVSDMAFSYDKIQWTTWEPYAIEKAFNLPPSDGEKFIYFKVRDKAGNSAIIMGSIILDTTPPHSLSIIINNGQPETDSNSVILNLHAIDNLSGVGEMTFSLDGGTWSDWEPFAAEKAITLAPTRIGERTLYFRVRDRVGNEAPPVEGQIRFNITLPMKVQSKETAVNYEIWYILVIIIILIVIFILFVVKRKKERIWGLPEPGQGIIEQELNPTQMIQEGNLAASLISTTKTNNITTPIQTTAVIQSEQITETAQKVLESKTQVLNASGKIIFPPQTSWAPNSPKIKI